MPGLVMRAAYAAAEFLNPIVRLMSPPTTPPPYDAPLCPGCTASLLHPAMPTTGVVTLGCGRCGTRSRWDVSGELPIMLTRV